MTPSFAEPPTPQRFFSRPASSRTPASSSGTPDTAVTALPRLPAVSRRTFTRPPEVRSAARGSRALRRSPSLDDHTTFASARLTTAASSGLARRGRPVAECGEPVDAHGVALEDLVRDGGGPAH